ELHSGHLEAWITTEVQRSEVACATECEIVTLHVRGAAADHLDALVDPLLVSGVPTYLWWMGTPPFDKRELLEALRICDGLVVDSAQFERPYHTFRGLSELLKVAHHRMGLGDMQWARLKPWRESIAQFFTPRDRRAFLNGISEVGVDYEGEGRGNRIAASLLTGGLAPGVRPAGRRSDWHRDGLQQNMDSLHHTATGEAPGEGRPRPSTVFTFERRRSDSTRVLLTIIEVGEGAPLRHVQQLDAEDVPS